MKLAKIVFIINCLVIGFVSAWVIKPSQFEYVYIARDVDPKNISIDDPKLIKAIIKVESNGDRFAKSNKGAYGLMQVRYEVWKKDLANIGILSHWGLYDPSKNVEAGKYILAQHHKQAKGNLRKTLQDYSGGASGYYEKVMYHYLTHKEE